MRTSLMIIALAAVLSTCLFAQEQHVRTKRGTSSVHKHASKTPNDSSRLTQTPPRRPFNTTSIDSLRQYRAYWNSIAAAKAGRKAQAATDTVQKPSAQAKHRRVPSSEVQKKTTEIPSIIQSELDRSRAEEKQRQKIAPVEVQIPVRQAPASSSLWPVILAVLIAGCITAGIVYFLFLRPKAAQAVRQSEPAPVYRPMPAPMSAPIPVAPRPAPVETPAPERWIDDASDPIEEEQISSAAPYAIEDENEMPEAALTMNLINKKRERKKELIQEVMRRVQRKEKPQQIAEALHVGIGEVQLAIKLAKLKK